MKNIWKWVLLFVLVFALVFVAAVPFFMHSTLGAGFGWGMYPGRGMMSFNGPFGGMHGGFGFFGGPFMMAGRFLGPILFLGLVVLVIILAVNLFKKKQPTRACSNCGKPLQMEWMTCPHCGHKVE